MPLPQIHLAFDHLQGGGLLGHQLERSCGEHVVVLEGVSKRIAGLNGKHAVLRKRLDGRLSNLGSLQQLLKRHFPVMLRKYLEHTLLLLISRFLISTLGFRRSTFDFLLSRHHPPGALEFAASAANGTGEYGSNARLKGSAVVGAHPAGELEDGVVDIGLIVNERLNRLQGVERAGLGKPDDIAGNMPMSEGNGDAAADLDRLREFRRDRIVELPVKRYINDHSGDHK